MAINSIGSTGTYADIQAWLDDCPASLLEDWIGELQNEEHLVTVTNTLGATTKNGYQVLLRCVSGGSLLDHADVLTSSPHYDTAKGACVRATTGYRNFQAAEPWDFHGIMFDYVRSNVGIGATGKGTQCIFETQTSQTRGLVKTLGNIENSIIFASGGAVTTGNANARIRNCTIYGTGQPYAVANSYGAVGYDNCAFYNFLKIHQLGSGAGTLNLLNCFIELASWGDATQLSTTNCTVSVTIANEVESATGVWATTDLRLKGDTSTVMLDGGFDNSSLYTVDVVGQTRDATFDIGAWEYVSAGGLSITSDFITGGNTLYEPTVNVGAVTITAGFIASGNVLHEPTVQGSASSQNITSGFIASGNSLYEPTIAGSIVSQIGFVGSGNVLYEPTVNVGAVALAIDYIASGNVLHEPTVNAGAVSLSIDYIASGSTTYEPVLDSSGAILLDYITSGNSLYEPSVNVGAVSLSIDYIASGTALYDPSVSTGIAASNIACPFIACGNSLYEPSVNVGAVVLSVDYIAPTTSLYEPSFGGQSTAQVDFIAPGSVVHEPAVTGSYTVSVDYINSTATFYVPNVNAGAVFLTPSFIASTVVMYEPVVVDAAFDQNYEIINFELGVSRQATISLGVSRLATFTLNVSRSRSQS